MTTFAILDPSLKSFNGHFLTYDNVVAEAVAAKGLRPIIFSSQAIEKNLPAACEVVPTFRDGLERAFFRGPITARALSGLTGPLLRKRFLEDMLRELTPDRLGHTPVVFMHTTTHHQIPAMVDWVEANRKILPLLIILLRYAPSPNPYYPNSGATEGYRRALAHVRDRGMERYVRLVTDSDNLIDEYKLLTDVPLHLLPIPHTVHHNPAAREPSVPLLTYLGNARATKGFQYLPFAVRRVAAELDSGAWAAEFQANVMFERDIDSVLAVKLLRQQNVLLHERELTTEEYSNLLLRSSLVLVPYQLLYYYAQTSGVLCEALASGKPVVVPRGTWMARQIKGRNAGELFLPGDRESFADAVQKAMRSINSLKAGVEAMREEWVGYHNPTNFADEIMKLVA